MSLKMAFFPLSFLSLDLVLGHWAGTVAVILVSDFWGGKKCANNYFHRKLDLVVPSIC